MIDSSRQGYLRLVHDGNSYNDAVKCDVTLEQDGEFWQAQVPADLL